MGKTNPTYRQTVESFESRFQPYRRALRYQHQDAFDKVMEKIRAQSMAGGAANPRDPKTAYWLSAMVGLQLEVDDLRTRLSHLESEVSAGDRDQDGGA